MATLEQAWSELLVECLETAHWNATLEPFFSCMKKVAVAAKSKLETEQAFIKTDPHAPTLPRLPKELDVPFEARKWSVRTHQKLREELLDDSGAFV